jgi:hypothetical protein
MKIKMLIIVGIFIIILVLSWFPSKMVTRNIKA